VVLEFQGLPGKGKKSLIWLDESKGGKDGGGDKGRNFYKRSVVDNRPHNETK
jgi:hypothetical protein